MITEEQVSKAVGALEVRSSSFLLKKYDNFMLDRTNKSLNIIKDEILKIKSNSQLDELLRNKDKVIYDFIHNATIENIESLSFRQRSWSSTPALRELTEHLKIIKENIKIVQKRDYLSITPKLEDIALVNRWIQKYNVPHFYLQVFFDCAYIISFADILKIASDPNKEGHEFTIEKDIKNQGKTTIKINIRYTDLIIDQIKMPNHYSAMKELDRGRLLFFVKFKGGEGCLELDAFNKILGLNK